MVAICPHKFARAALFLLLCNAALAQQLTLTQREGEYRLRLNADWISAPNGFDGDGVKRSFYADSLGFQNQSFGETDIGIHWEIGVTDWLTAEASTKFRTAVLDGYYPPLERDSTISASGLGDTWVGARARFTSDSSSIAAASTFSVKIPSGSPNQPVPLGTGYPEYSVGAALLVPFTIHFPAAFELAAAYRIRVRNTNDLPWMAKLELTNQHGIVIIATLDGVLTTAGVEQLQETPFSLNAALLGPHSWLRGGIEAAIQTSEKLDVLVRYAHDFSGRNALNAGTFGIGAVWHTAR